MPDTCEIMQIKNINWQQIQPDAKNGVPTVGYAGRDGIIPVRVSESPDEFGDLHNLVPTPNPVICRDETRFVRIPCRA